MARSGPSGTTFAPRALACRIFGCRFRFAADEHVLRWWCQRSCPSGGSKGYPSPADAARMAAAPDREPRGPAAVLAPLGGTVHREPREP